MSKKGKEKFTHEEENVAQAMLACARYVDGVEEPYQLYLGDDILKSDDTRELKLKIMEWRRKNGE